MYSSSSRELLYIISLTVKHLYLTIAVDIVAEGIPEPVRITRSVKFLYSDTV